jgi:histidyl-tRNA synthetase
MVAARQASLPEPIRWFNVSRCFRYERAQKGRQREFFQWNVDLLGLEGEIADAECISVAVDSLRELGLTPADAEVLISDRRLTSAFLVHLGIPDERVEHIFAVLDKRDKVPPEALAEMLVQAGLDTRQREGIERILSWRSLSDIDRRELETPEVRLAVEATERLFGHLADYGIADWCRFDIGIVRGLAYYTGPVWEVHDRKGELRAVFGGGRYDRLLADLGGKPMPACGFGCGDVVLGILLGERGLAPETEAAADCYVISNTRDWAQVLQVVNFFRKSLRLRTQFDMSQAGFNRQHKNAVQSGARFKAIVGKQPWPGIEIIDAKPPDGGAPATHSFDLLRAGPLEVDNLRKALGLSGGLA